MIILSKITKVVFYNSFLRSGFIEDSNGGSEGFIIYDNGIIAFDHYQSTFKGKALTRLIRKELKKRKEGGKLC